ncbi:MAG TPA: N-acetylglucosamine-6-phosphate deacetylase [Bauldia sp.]|nr:N-acetylglucosamine-6-phosphate deacetylase [Bauldia sp.]
MAMTALTGARVFDGTRLVDGQAVLLDGARIAGVLAARDIPAGAARRRIEGLLAPGFIDTQVNGGGGVLFNDTRSAAGIAAIGAAHRRFGTTGFLPTFITDTHEHMAEAVAAATAARRAGVPGALGVHLEGPFLNPERKGVHLPHLMRSVEEADIRVIAGADAGKVMMTVAPEMVPVATLKRLVELGVVLSAGHTRADYNTIRAARAAGLTGFTHLFNAMPPLAGREPGPVGAALDDPDAYVGLIVDLFHVSPVSLRIAIAARGWERMMLVTDAMPSVGSDTASFDLHGRTVTRRDGRLTTGDGTIAGSDLDMATAVRNTVAELGLPLEAALHMASLAPAEFLGLGRELGRIAPGYRGSLVLLDDGLMVRETWIDGRSSSQ